MKPVYEFRPNMKSVNLEAAAQYSTKGLPDTRKMSGEKRASRVMVVVESKSKTHRIVAPTKSHRQSVGVFRRSLRSMYGLKGQPTITEVMSVKPIEPKPTKKVKWVMSKVQRVMRLKEEGNHRVSMWKVTNNFGVKKYFVSRKAAMIFRQTFDTYVKGK
jgi:hypothetical protein